jgi:hypothetical protein
MNKNVLQCLLKSGFIELLFAGPCFVVLLCLNVFSLIANSKLPCRQALFGELSDDHICLRFITCFDDDIEVREFDWDILKEPLMGNFNNVATDRDYLLRDFGKRVRLVGDGDAKPNDSACSHQAAH